MPIDTFTVTFGTLLLSSTTKAPAFGEHRHIKLLSCGANHEMFLSLPSTKPRLVKWTVTGAARWRSLLSNLCRCQHALPRSPAHSLSRGRPHGKHCCRPLAVGEGQQRVGSGRPARVLRALPDSGHSQTGGIAFSPSHGSTMPAVSLCPSRCFRDALDQVQRRQHEHLFRFGLDTEEAALLELAVDVSQQLLLRVVADGVQRGLRL